MKIMLIGMPGCGKTTIGKKVANNLDLRFIDIDSEIVKTKSISINKIFSEFGENYFRDLETKLLLSSLKYENVLISSGGGIIKKKTNIVQAKKNNCYIIFIDRPIDLIVKDIDTSTRPLLKDDAEKIKKIYNERYDIYKSCADFIVINDSNFKSIVKKVENICIEVGKRE